MQLSAYIPCLTTIKSIISENEANDIKTFELVFRKEEDQENFDYNPGQFAEISVIGKGECPIGIASSPTEKGSIKFTIKKMGTVTTAMHMAEVGDAIGVRGPLGNGWPIEELKGKNIIVIGGGFAFSTLRSLVEFIIHDDNRADYKEIIVIYGNRNCSEILYQEDLMRWKKREDVDVALTIDCAEKGWDGRVGFVAPIVESVDPSPKNSIAIMCGPPIMIKTTEAVLEKLHFQPGQILESLENRMKCGIGKCGRCNIGDKFVCVDGPVFSKAELNKMPREY